MVEVAALVAWLAPALPYLVKVGGKVVEGASTKIGEDAWNWAKRLWGKLEPKVEANPFAARAAQTAAQAPTDDDALAGFRSELKKLLAEDPTFANELSQLWSQTKVANVSVTVTAYGAGAVAVGGNVTGSTISTGGQNAPR